jgi:hypothetical protein
VSGINSLSRGKCHESIAFGPLPWPHGLAGPIEGGGHHDLADDVCARGAFGSSAGSVKFQTRQTGSSAKVVLTTA